MALGVILTVLIIIITAFVVHKLLQEALDLMHIAVSVAGILIAIMLVVVISDAIGFKKNFPESDNLLVIMDNSTASSAFVLKGSSSGLSGTANGVEPLSETQISSLKKNLAAKDYKTALGNNYKLLLMEKEAVEAAAKNGIIANGRNYSSPEVMEALETGEGAVLKALVTKLTDNPALFIPQYKKGGIYIYPESNMFKVIRYVPLFGMDALKGALEKIGRFAGIKNEG